MSSRSHQLFSSQRPAPHSRSAGRFLPASVTVGPMPSGRAGNHAPSGCRVRFCAGTTSRQRLASRTKCGPGSPGERDVVCCSGWEAGRRRTICVVAALSTRARLASESGRRREARTALTAASEGGRGAQRALAITHARPRRWCDAGPGRQCVPAAQKAGAESMVRNHGSDWDSGRIRTRRRRNSPASVHHRRRRDAGATNIAAPFVTPAFRGRWNLPASALPREAPMRSALPATRQAAGVPSA